MHHTSGVQNRRTVNLDEDDSSYDPSHEPSFDAQDPRFEGPKLEEHEGYEGPRVRYFSMMI